MFYKIQPAITVKIVHTLCIIQITKTALVFSSTVRKFLQGLQAVTIFLGELPQKISGHQEKADLDECDICPG